MPRPKSGLSGQSYQNSLITRDCSRGRIKVGTWPLICNVLFLAIIVLCIMNWNMWVGIGISIFSIISSMIIKGVQANHYYAQPMAFIHGNWTQGGHGGNVHFDHPFFANRSANLKL